MSGERATGIIRLLPSFLAGLFLAMFGSLEFMLPGISLVLIIVILFSFKFIIPSKKQYATRWMTGFFIHLAVFLSAYLITIVKSEINFKNHFSKFYSVDALICTVNEAPVLKGKNFRFEVEVEELHFKNYSQKVRGKCLMYIRIDSLLVKPSYGDRLLFLRQPQEVLQPMNPGAFDFQAWLKNKNIYHQVFLKNDEFLLLEKDQGNYFLALAISWRNYLMKAIHDAGIIGQNEAVLSALILGQDDEIDSELRQSYSTAGVMHILAVSGMHVGLIYGALCALLRFPGRLKKWKFIKAFILIICLWFYAMLTGLSPSVLRAAMMLSFILIGMTLERSANPLNILAASALCLFVIFNPALIFSAGFQLSYLAVGGILFLYKPLQACITPKTWIGAQIWSILAVSIVAQLATFPLSLYYFHRFPNYFLLSNLLVIPLGTIVIFGGIIVLFLSWWTPVALFLGKILSFLIQILNESVKELGNLPGASTDSIYLSLIGMALLYLAIFLFAYYLLKVRLLYFLYFLSSLILFNGFLLFEKMKSLNQNFMIIYHSPKQTYIQFFQHTQVTSICDSLLSTDDSRRKRITENIMLEHGISSEKVISSELVSENPEIHQNLIYKIPFIQFGSEKMYILNRSNENFKPGSGRLDYILISSNPKVKPQAWLEGLNCKTIIADASNSPWKLKAWKDECAKRGIEFVNVAETGAFVHPMKLN